MQRVFAAAKRAAANFQRDQRGTVALYLTVAFTSLIGVCALGAEGAYWLYTHRIVQSAADSAAYSAAAAYGADNTSDLTAQARAIAANDYNLVNGQDGASVTVNRPPLGSCYSGTSHYTGSNAVEVVVSQTRSPLFSAIWSSADRTICGRAIALVPAKGDCLLSLGTSGTVMSVTSNNLSVNLTNCGLFSNSSDVNSISLNGNNDVLNAYSVGTVGGITTNGNARTTVFNPAAGAPPVADPYASAATSWPTSGTTPSVPQAPPPPSTLVSAGSFTPAAGCSNGKNGNKTVTVQAGSFTSQDINKLQNCTTITLSAAGTYVFSSALNILSGATMTVPSGSTIAVTSGGLTNAGTITFSGGDNWIYVQAGGFINSGTVTLPGTGTNKIYVQAGGMNNTASGAIAFSSTGNATLYVQAGGLTNAGTTTFSGSGSNALSVAAGAFINTGTLTFSAGTASVYVHDTGLTNSSTINFTGSSGDSILIQAGGLTNSGTMTFGSGNFTIAVTGGWSNSSNLTMGSGTYAVTVTGNLTLTGSSSTLGKGIYYISGNLNITGTGGQTVTANLVTLVLTGNSSIINYTANNATLTLTAPTASGWNQAIAIWEPNSTATNQLAAGNSSIATITGVFYAPKANVNYAGNTGNTPVCTQIVANAVTFAGNTINITADCGGSPGNGGLLPGMKLFGEIPFVVE